MKAYLNPCPLCDNNNPEILFPAKYQRQSMILENIVICKTCGLVYKYPVIPDYEILHYMTPGHWDSSYFDRKLKDTAAFITREYPTVYGVVMDVGAAAGHLLNHLSEKYTSSQLVGLEPSINACQEAKTRNANLLMLPTTLEDAAIPEESISLITAIGVDYLFLDHNVALRKINSLLKVGGHFYIERNVFLESKAYVSQAIRTTGDLFETNSMMKNWFTEEQFKVQLSKYFDLGANNRYVSNSVGGNPNVHIGWLCRKKIRINEKVAVGNEYEKNKAYIMNMQRG